MADAKRREEELKAKEQRLNEERRIAAMKQEIRDEEKARSKLEQDVLRKEQETLLKQILSSKRRSRIR